VPYYQSHQSGIETFQKPVRRTRHLPTNRTNLELKRSSRFRNGDDPRATNRTNLELKRFLMRRIYIDVLLYQSHQSGIETNNIKACLLLDNGYQSHQSGIETASITSLKSGNEFYQSHQSGIETKTSGVTFGEQAMLPIAPIWN